MLLKKLRSGALRKQRHKQNGTDGYTTHDNNTHSDCIFDENNISVNRDKNSKSVELT